MTQRHLKGMDISVPESDHSSVHFIKTKCPSKWYLTDAETGVIYVPETGNTGMSWRPANEWELTIYNNLNSSEKPS